MSPWEPDSDWIGDLEPDQLTADRTRPVPPARLSRGVSTGLWVLRMLALLLTAMVIYAFFWQVGH